MDIGQSAVLALQLRANGIEMTEKNLEKAVRSANKVADAFDRVEKKLKDETQASKDNTRTSRDLTRAKDDASKSTENFNKQLTVSSGRLKVIGRDINRYVTLPLLAFSGVSVKFASDLNQGLSNVQALLTDTGDRIFELKDGVKDLAVQTGRSFSDINSALYRTISVFQDNEDTVDRLNTAVRASIAGNATAAETVQLLSSVTRAFGDTSKEAVQKVANLAFETVRLGDTTIPALSAAMQVATDRADRLNISQEELFTTFATLTGITGDASMVATQFRSAMDSLLNPTQALTELFESMGFATAEAALQERGMIGVLSAIAREAERTGRPLQEYITRKEGMTLVSRLAGEQMTDFISKLAQVSTGTGAMAKAYENVTEGVGKFNFQLNQNKMRLQVAFSEIGDNLLPVMVALTGVLASLIEGFTTLPTWLQNTMLITLALVSAFGTLAQIMGVIRSLQMAGVFVSITKAVNGLTVGTLALGKALTVATGVFGLVIATSVAVATIIATGERRKKEAIELSTTALEAQYNTLLKIQNLESSRRLESQSMSAMFLQQFTDEGKVPEFFKGTVTQGLQITQTGSAELGNQSSKFVEVTRENARRLYDEYNALLREIKEKDSELQRQITFLEERTIVTNQEYAKVVTGQNLQILQGLSGAAGIEFNASTFVNASQRIQNEMITALRDGWIENMGGIDELIGDELPLQILNKFSEVVGNSLANRNDLAILEQKLNTVADPAIRAQLEAAIQFLASQLGESIPEIKKTWQEWFAQLTMLEFEDIRGMSGTNVSKLYSDALDEIFNIEEQITGFFGLEPQTEQLLKSQAQDIVKLLRDMFIQANADLPEDQKFTPNDFLIGREGVDTNLLNKYKKTVDNLASVVGQNLVDSWEKEESRLSELNALYTKHGLDVEGLELTYSDYESRINSVYSAMDLLTSMGVDPASEAFLFFSGLLDEIAAKMSEFREEVVLTVKSFDAFDVAMDVFAPGDVGDVFKRTMFESLFSDQFKADLVLFAQLQDKLATEGFLSDSELNKMDSLAEGFKKATFEMLAFEIAVQVMVASAQLMADAFWDFGRALAEGGTAQESLEDAFISFVRSLSQKLPELFIAAGLQAVIAGQFALGAGLIATGLGFALAGGFLDGTTNTMAKGGILNTPTRIGNNYMGEAGPEAVLPLSYNQDGVLGVQAVGGASEVYVDVNVYNNAGVEVEQRTNDDGSIDIIIEKAVRNAIGSGMVDREMSNRYGMRARGRG